MTWHLSLSLDLHPATSLHIDTLCCRNATSFVICITSPYCSMYLCISCTFLSLKEYSPYLSCSMHFIFLSPPKCHFFPLKSSQLSSILYPFSVTLYLNYTFIIVYIMFTVLVSSLHMCPTLKCQYFERVYD